MNASGPSLPVPTGLRRSAYDAQAEWMASARFAAELLATTAARPRLEGLDLLDVGCGTKLTKTLIDDEWPIASYAGIDVSEEVIEWLRSHVEDPRFSFHHLPARNQLYNPGGEPLRAFSRLPVGDESFDVICLFSVFTHLDPVDYVAMLKLLRHCVRPDGTLLFSLFLKDPKDNWARILERALSSDDPAVVRRAAQGIAKKMSKGDVEPPFVDEVPGEPLLRARYDRTYALSLVEGTGWTVKDLRPPGQYIQNYMICQPQ